MYILCNSKTTEQFLRFGKRFSHGKSINYLAMSPRVKELYSCKLAELQYGHITEEEFNDWCESALEDFVWEPHISCFYLDTNYNLPIVENISQVKTLIGFIQRFESNLPCEIFIVEGEEVGAGTDSEPLVDIIRETPIDINVDKLITVVENALDFNSEYKDVVDYSEDSLTAVGIGLQYKDTIYYNFDSDFLGNWEYKGKVMDKFKYESEYIPETNEFVCKFLSFDCFDDTEEIDDQIWEWGHGMYSDPEYFEDTYHIAIHIDSDGAYIYGDIDSVDEFESAIGLYIENTEPTSDIIRRYNNKKFYT